MIKPVYLGIDSSALIFIILIIFNSSKENNVQFKKNEISMMKPVCFGTGSFGPIFVVLFAFSPLKKKQYSFFNKIGLTK